MSVFYQILVLCIRRTTRNLKHIDSQVYVCWKPLVPYFYPLITSLFLFFFKLNVVPYVNSPPRQRIKESSGQGWLRTHSKGIQKTLHIQGCPISGQRGTELPMHNQYLFMFQSLPSSFRESVSHTCNYLLPLKWMSRGIVRIKVKVCFSSFLLPRTPCTNLLWLL